ncbi:MAG: accessory gene regulator B family protein, partial [Clostridia bacterium]
KNKPLDEDEKIRYRKITLRNLLIECVAVIVLLELNQLSFAFAISISIGVTAILLLIEEKE